MKTLPTPRHGAVSEPQSVAAVLMVRPAHFAFNPETAASNSFQSAPVAGSAPTLGVQALREFDALAAQLQRAGVRVIVALDSVSPRKPDALFPNNWVSLHRDGTVVLYPMLAPNRRLERRDAILRQVAREGDYEIARTVDLSHREVDGRFLEGTGSLVLDRVNHIAYAGLSPRTDFAVLSEFADIMGYELLIFEGLDAQAKPVYHTNVLLAIGARFAVICGESMAASARAAVIEKLSASGHEVMNISMQQMHCFGGNLLELAPVSGKVIALSQGAWSSLSAAQRRTLERHGSILAADLACIEHFGGGGVRCMLAEIHLPERAAPRMS